MIDQQFRNMFSVLDLGIGSWVVFFLSSFLWFFFYLPRNFAVYSPQTQMTTWPRLSHSSDWISFENFFVAHTTSRELYAAAYSIKKKVGLCGLKYRFVTLVQGRWGIWGVGYRENLVHKTDLISIAIDWILIKSNYYGTSAFAIIRITAVISEMMSYIIRRMSLQHTLQEKWFGRNEHKTYNKRNIYILILDWVEDTKKTK